MQFSSILLAAAAFALTNASPMFTMPTSFFSAGITAGSTVNLTWSGASGAVTLLLKNGNPSNLQTVSTIASGLTGTSYGWTVPASLANGEYALEIDDTAGVPNYSEQFALSGGSASVSSSATSSTASGSTTVLTTSASTTSAPGNSTSTSPVKTGPPATKASTTASSSSTSTSTSTPNSNSAASFASPLAFVFLAFAAMMTIN